MHADTRIYDLAVIGAGLYGIQAARTYLELHQDANVIVFEASSNVGGVWSKDRVYDGFWTQTPISLAQFSDRAMSNTDPLDNLHGYIPATYVTEYLQRYVKSHIYDGKSLESRIWLNTPVRRLSKSEDKSWLLDIGPNVTRFGAVRVIDASGQTSQPMTPKIDGLPSFKGQVIHQLDFAQCDVLCNSRCEIITVVGAAKSAADLAYICSKNPEKSVQWIIRRSGCGPAAFLEPKFPGYHNSTDAVSTRLFSRCTATIHNRQSRSWLYDTAIGRAIFRRVWAVIDKAISSAARYNRADGRARGFFNLRPDTSIFWSENSPGIAVQPDFYESIAKNVTVYRQDIVKIHENHIILEDGTSLQTDTIIFATGWENTHSYLSAEDKASLGLPVLANEATGWIFGPSNLDDEQSSNQDWDILSQLLASKDDKAWYDSSSQRLDICSTYRLWKYIMPLEEQSLLFLGAINTGNNFIMAEVQALWAVALFDGLIEIPFQGKLRSEVNTTLLWNKHRYRRKGSSGIWLYFDMLPYSDSLLEQMGLESHLKCSGRLFSKLLRPIDSSQYSNILHEYRTKYKHIYS